MLVAFLADLGHLRQAIPDPEPGPHRQGVQFDAAGGDVFRKFPRGQVAYPQGRHFVDALLGQQADLPVPVARMGVSR